MKVGFLLFNCHTITCLGRIFKGIVEVSKEKEEFYYAL